MRLRNTLISSAVAAALGTAGPAVVFGQSADQPTQTQSATQNQPAAQLEEIVVTGIRASLQNAQSLKENSPTIQDSIVASDIGKLPDVTAVEALQRITGVQIGRDLGEGGGTVSIGGSSVNSGIEIRGLPQVETTLNGREVFSATGSRVLNFEDIPSSLLAGIDVYKDPTADLLEGGIGGTVDLRTHKPFDFQGLEIESSAAEQYGDMVGTAKPEFTALASDRWETGVGEMGALLSFGYQDRSYREDVDTEGAILTNNTIVPGQTSTLINGSNNYDVLGERKRVGLDGVFQWQPADDLQTYAEVSSEELTSKQSQYSFYSQGNANVVPGSVSFFQGTTVADSVTYNNAAVGSIGAWRQVTDVNRQAALNAKWTPGAWTVVGDVSYTTGYESLDNPAVLSATKAATLTESDGLGGLVTSSITGLDMTNLANYTGNTAGNFQSYMYDTVQHFRGNEKAAKLDGSYAFDSGFVTSLQAGIRFAERVADFNQGSMFGAVSDADLQSNPQWFGLEAGSPAFSSIGRTVEPIFTVFNPQELRYNASEVIAAYAAACPTCGLTQLVDSGANDYRATEKNDTAYFRGNFGWDIGIPMDGNIGVRVVHHQDYLYGMQSVSGVLQPDRFSNGEVDALPSLNLRFKLRDDLQLRFAASKAVTYPDFTQISPSQSILPAQGLATGGNPNLKPTKANQVDGSLEYYFGPASSLTFDLFYKRLTDFVLQETQQDAFVQNGKEFNLTGAVNGPSGTIRGTEIAYQQFLDFLPGLLSGIGYQLNYTYVDATAPSAVAGATTTLPGLSKNNFNVIAIYEKGPVSFRAAYTWRSQFYTSLYAGSTGAVSPDPVFTKQFGWLDASLNYAITNQWTVYATGSNLLRTRLVQFYGSQTIPNSYTINDREGLLGVRFKFN
jgi:iron complex outermembrane recepter protein